jgi:hypothetical protein
MIRKYLSLTTCSIARKHSMLSLPMPVTHEEV